MNDERIPVELIDKTWQTNASGALVKCECHYAIKRSDLERVVLDVYRREQLREWNAFKAGCGRGDALPTGPAPLPEPTAPQERPQHNTLRGLPTQDPFREAVRELVDGLEVADGRDNLQYLCAWRDALVKVKAMLEARM